MTGLIRWDSPGMTINSLLSLQRSRLGKANVSLRWFQPQMQHVR
jgi:hypothetical protein